MADAPATIGRYEIRRRLGNDGFAALYLAFDPAIERLVTIRVLHESLPAETREPFVRAIRNVARVRHPSIAAILDVGEADGRPYAVTAYIEGETVARIIRERRSVPLVRKLEWLEQICAGLAFAHRAGFLHRDVRPANVMIDGASASRILNFGVAWIGELVSRELSGAMLKATNYMSPELIHGLAGDHRSDVFGVGAVAYELIAYRRAFDGATTAETLHRILYEAPVALSTLVPNIDEGLAPIVDRALAKVREERYQDLDEMRADLARVRQRLNESTAPPGEIGKDAPAAGPPLRSVRDILEEPERARQEQQRLVEVRRREEEERYAAEIERQRRATEEERAARQREEAERAREAAIQREKAERARREAEEAERAREASRQREESERRRREEEERRYAAELERQRRAREEERAARQREEAERAREAAIQREKAERARREAEEAERARAASRQREESERRRRDEERRRALEPLQTIALPVPEGVEPPGPSARPPLRTALPKTSAGSAGDISSTIWRTVTAPFRLLARLPDAISGRSRAVPPSSSDAASAAPPPSSDGAASAAPPSSSDAAAPLVPEPVLLGASAPRRVTPTEKFLVRFAAYIEAAEAHVSVQFRGVDALERRGDRQVALGLPTTRASRWVVGAPVTVRLRGDGVTADPPSHVFEWNGRYNLLFFTVSLAAAASAAHLQLMLEAFIEGVPVGCVPLTIEVGEGAPATQPITSVMRPFSTAFASYASQDAPLVSLCLSALHRWDPGMQVFMDCLDLTPNENWKRELEAIIPTKDAFLLFWSVNARKSEWVAWELKVATSSPRGVESVLPMPLEDPAVAPPPDVLKHLHFRDRYLLARAALTKTARATL